MLAVGPRSAHAGSKLFVDLSYEVDATLSGCPDEAAFKGLVKSQLGYDPFRPGSRYKVLARTEAEEDGLTASVQWSDASGAPRGERELTQAGDDCAGFARAVSFAVAVQIQLLEEETESAASAATPSEPGRGDEPPATPEDSKPSPPRLEPTLDDERGRQDRMGSDASLRWMVGAGPAVGLGLIAGPAIEARVFAGVRYDRLLLELGAEASLPSRHTTTNGEGFDQRVVLGSLAECVFLGSLSSCLVTKVGRFQVHGFGVDVPRSSSGVVAELGPRLALNEELGTWATAFRVEVLATLVPWKVTLTQEEVWKAPVVSGLVGVDLAILLGGRPVE